jgi:hypothetical protein
MLWRIGEELFYDITIPTFIIIMFLSVGDTFLTGIESNNKVALVI